MTLWQVAGILYVFVKINSLLRFSFTRNSLMNSSVFILKEYRNLLFHLLRRY